MTRAIALILTLAVTTSVSVAQTPELIDTWIVQESILPAATQTPGAVIVGSNMYIIGGNNGTDTDEVWRLPVGAVTLGASAAETSLPATNNFAYICESTVATSDHIYISGGGWNSSVPTLWDRVHHIEVNLDGTLGASWAESAVFPNSYVAQLGGAAIGDNGFLYCFGGADDNAGTFYDDCYYAQINGDGSLGAWQTGTSLPEARWFNGVCIVGDYLIVAPGISATLPSASVITDEVWVCQLNADGSMGTWAVQTETLPAPRYNINLVAVNDTIFAIGGRDDTGAGQDNVWRATFDTDTGTVGAWATTDQQLPTGTHYHDVDYSPISRRLYIVGVRTVAAGAASNQAFISNDLFPPPVTAVEDWSLFH